VSADGARASDDRAPGRAIDAAIFDLGGVIMRNGSPADFTRRFPDLDGEQILEILMGPYHQDTDHPWHRLERGEIGLLEAISHHREALAEAGLALSTPLSGSFEFEINDAMVGLVRELREAGVATALLTNNVRELRARWFSLLPYDELFDTVVDSHEVGMRKPNPAIYQLTLDRLSVSADRVVFLDDIHSNTVAAAELGMIGLTVVDEGTEAIGAVRSLAGLA
jgi:epoxide hydrolase-like predicted phosphatase